MSKTALQMLDIEPKMVLEIASGIRDPKDIAAEYGYSESEWEALKVFEPFVKAIDSKKIELTASGYTFRLKAATAAEDILADVYLAAKNEDASFHTRLESLKFMARAAGLDAPAKEEAETGAQFSITIDLGGGQTVEIGAAKAKNAQKTVENDDYYTEIEGETEHSDFDSTTFFKPYEPIPLDKTGEK